MAYSSKYTEELLKTKKKKKTYAEQVLSGEYKPLTQEVKVKTDIAPVKTTKKEDSLFSAFDDGWDFGDISKTILKGGKKLGTAVFETGKEVVTNPIQSAKAFGVGTVSGIDKANTLINNAVDDFFVWASPFRDKEDEEGTLSLSEFNKLSSETDEATKKKLLETYKDKYGKDSTLYQTLKLQLETKPADKNLLNMKYTDTETYKKAVEGKLSDGQENIYGIGENVGQMLPSMAVGGVAGGLAGSGVFFTQVQQGYTEDALARGYEDKDARIYGLVMGGAELLVERVSSKIGLGVDETKGFQQLSLKNIKKTMAGEGLEEFVMPYIDDVVSYNDLVFNFEDGYNLEEFKESTEEALEGAVMGATVGVIMSAGGRGLQKVDTVIQKANAGQEITQNDLVQAGKEIQENAPELLEEAMKEVPLVVQEQLAKDVTSEDVAVQEDIAPVGEDVVQQLEQDNIPIVEANQEQTVQQAGQQDTQQVDETELKRQYYVSEAKETDSQYRKNLNEDASKFANNTKRTHEFVNTLSNVSESTGISIRLTNNTSEDMVARKQQLIENYAKKKNVSVEEATAKFKDIIIDGYKTKDGVVINVNSPKALNRLVGHEITHILEKTNGYSKLQKIAIDYAKTKNDYNDRVEVLEALYDGVQGEVSKELTSDIVGDYLFTDQAFIERIQQTDRNLFQRIYDEVKHLIKMATAGSKEARQLEQLKHTFEQVMRENKEISNKASKVTVQETKTKSATEVESNTQEKTETVQEIETDETSKVSENVEAETKIEDTTKEETTIEEDLSLSVDNKGRKLTKAQEEYFKDSKVRDENGNLLTMYHGTSSGGHTVFDPYGGRPGLFGQGSYFTADNTVAESYTEKGRGNNKQIYEVYLNITNPINMDGQANVEEWKQHFSKHIPEATFPESGTNEELYRFTLEEFENTEYDRFEVAEIMIETLQKMGYDGITHIGGGRFNQKDETRHRVYITFDSNQIKEVTNKQPTLDDDIRYSLSEKTTDSEGKELSKKQIEFFKDSKVRDSQGRLLEVYHGTIEEFTTFYPGSFFTDDYMNADGYASGEIVMPVYLNIKNPLIIDAKGMKWDNLDTPYGTSTREIVGNVDTSKYDGVIFENINDNWFDDESGYPGTVYYTFESNQIKDVDNTNPTESDDIRYSLSVSEANTTKDNKNRELTEGQKEYFKDSKVLDDNGNLLTVYHGTTEEINVFDKARLGSNTKAPSSTQGFFFTANKEVAEAYSMYARPKYIQDLENKYQELEKIAQRTGSKDDWKVRDEAYLEYEEAELEYGYGGRKDYENQKEVYLNITNPLVHDFDGLEYRDESYYDLIRQAKENGNDGVILKNTYDGYGDRDSYWNPKTDIFVVFESNQAKNVDNENPTDDPDIRYSLSKVSTYEDVKYQALSDVLESDKVKQIAKELGIGYTMLDANISGQTIYGAIQFIKTYNPKIVEDYIANNNIKYDKMYDSNGEFDEYRTYQKAKEEAEKNGLNDYLYEKLKPLLDKKMLSSDELTKTAQEYYGTTDDFSIGAYMTPDGKLLDFDTYNSGYRDDHRDVSSIGYSMQEFIDAGNIRMKPEANGFEMTQEPTEQQYNTLRTYIDDYINGINYDTAEYFEYIIVDIDKGRNQYDSAEYKVGTPSSKIINDIKEYYRTGSFPKQSEVAEFRYSLSRTDQDIAPVKEVDVFGSEITVQEQVQEAIAPLQEQIETLTKTITDLQENIAPATQDLAEAESDRTLREITEEDIDDTEGTFAFDEEIQVKKKLEIIKELQRDFNIKHTEARELYNKIASIPEVTVEDIYTELENYRKVKFQEQDDYHKSIQDYIKGTKLNISDIKKQITDYSNTYRMANMGKGLTLANSGQSIDSFYQELSELYPNEFPDTVTAEVDQLELISQAMFKDTAFEYTETLDNDELQILAERIYSDIGNTERYKHGMSGLYFLNKEVKKMTPPGEINTDTSYEEYLSTLPGLLDGRYEPYLEQAREINASNTEQTEESVSIAEELNRLDIEQPSNLPRIESENPFDEMLDKFLKKEKKTPVPRVGKTKARNFRDTTQRLFVNEMVETDNLAKESGNKNIKFKGDMLNNVAGEIEGEIYTAQTDNEGHAIGKSISGLFAEAKKTGLYDAFNDYLEQYSNIDRHAQGKGSKTPLNVSQYLVREYEKSYPQFREWGKDVWKYGSNIRENLLKAGIIDKQFSDTLKGMYPHYVPYMENREMSNYYPDLGEAKPKGVIKRAKGGAENLLPIEDALTKYTFSSKKAIRQNQFYQEIVKTLGAGVDVGADVRTDPIELDDTLYKDETGNYLTAYVNGKRVSTRISDDLYTGLKNDLEHQIRGLEEKFALITDPVQKISEVRRNLLTSWNPMFIIRNPIMDVQDAVFNSKYTKDFIKNYPGAFVELSKANTETAKQFLTLYGSGNVMGEFSSDGTVKNSKFLKGIQKANNVMELAPRYAEFKASLDNGASIQEAMYNAREVTTNFGRGGVITKALNRNGFTFLNVSVQGFDKFVRNFSGENGAKGVAGAFLKAGLLGVLPAVFNELAFGGDDDEEKDEDYDALPDYIKDNYYLIKTGDGEFIRIPKGRMLSVFGMTARRMMEYTQGEEDAFEGLFKNAYSQVGISNPLDSNILTPLIQAYGSENGEAWYGGDLVPSRLQDKAPEEQYDSSTDKMSIWLGQQLGISPYKLNYVIDQYSGGVGDILLPFITEEATTDAEGGEMLLAPIKDQFSANSTSDNKYASDIYSLSDEMDKALSSVKETDEYKIQDSYLYSITSEMGKLYAERREVQSDDSLSKSEKYQKVQAIQDQINSLAKEGLDNYQNISKTDNYAIVGGREFNKYTSQEGEERWGSVREEVLSDLNSMGLDLEEKSAYFKATSSISETQKKYKDSDDYAGKKREIISTIKGTNLTDEAKAYLYDKYYASSDTLNVVTTIGMDFDSFLDFESQQFEADKNIYGKTISGSKKAKVFDYINSMNLSFEEKVILSKLQYNTYDEYNYEIIDYLNNRQDITYEEEVDILKKLGFTVDEYGNIYWD